MYLADPKRAIIDRNVVTQIVTFSDVFSIGINAVIDDFKGVSFLENFLSRAQKVMKIASSYGSS